MKNLNTLSKSMFIVYSLWIGLTITFIYRSVCFSSIYGITVFQSKLVLWVLAIFLVSLGTFITYDKRRNYFSIALNTVFPLEIYTIVSTYRYIPVIHIIALSVALLLSVAYFALIVFQKVKHQKYIKKIICYRIKFAFLGARTIFAILLLAVTVPICVKTVFGYELICSKAEVRIEDSEADKWSLSNNIETVAKLYEDTWNELSPSEKLDVLGTVKNVEMRYFGINHEVYLEAGDLDGETLGSYNAQEHRISIDIEHLKSSDAKEVLETLLHECRHVYDRMCVELYDHVDDDYKNMLMFYNIVEFKEEFNNYTNATDDLFDYYFQAIEISAREYSQSAVIEYFEYIYEYLNQTNNIATQE